MATFTEILKQPIINYQTGKLAILFEPNEDFRETYEELKDCDKLRIEIKRYRAKRSLDANAYYWTLLTKLSAILHTSNAEQHNRMLCLYGYPEVIDGKHFLVVLPDTDEAQEVVLQAEEYHLKPTSDVRGGNDGILYRTYILMRGSSTYNTEEMSRLIDGLISECKDAGLPESEIATPEEKRILKERYGVDIG